MWYNHQTTSVVRGDKGDIHTDTDTFTHAYQDTFTLAAYSEDRERSIKGVGLVVSCLCDAGRWAPRASAARLAGRAHFHPVRRDAVRHTILCAPGRGAWRKPKHTGILGHFRLSELQ